MATWAPVLRVLNLAAERVGQRRRALWPLGGFAVLAASVVITSLVCVGLGTELIGGPDRPTICDFDEFGCRPTVDRSGPATSHAEDAVRVLAGIALCGLAADAVLLISSRRRARTLTPGVREIFAAQAGTARTASETERFCDTTTRSPRHPNEGRTDD